METMTPEMRQAIVESGGSPPRFLDSTTHTSYVLLRSDIYDRIRSLIEPDEGVQPDEMATTIWEVMQGDWDDPAMDAYDNMED